MHLYRHLFWNKLVLVNIPTYHRHLFPWSHTFEVLSVHDSPSVCGCACLCVCICECVCAFVLLCEYTSVCTWTNTRNGRFTGSLGRFTGTWIEKQWSAGHRKWVSSWFHWSISAKCPEHRAPHVYESDLAEPWWVRCTHTNTYLFSWFGSALLFCNQIIHMVQVDILIFY